MNDDSDGVIGWAVAYPVSDPPPPQYPYSLTRNGALWFNRDQATDHHATAASLGHGWEKAFLVEVRRADVAERERRELAEYRRRYGTLDEEATA